MARYADEAADWIEDFSRAVRERRWRDIVADTEDFARRRPALFALGAIAAGFLAGRMLSASPDRRQDEKYSRREPAITKASDAGPHRGQTDEITAAVSNLATTPTGGPAGGNGELGSSFAGLPGAQEAR